MDTSIQDNVIVAQCDLENFESIAKFKETIGDDTLDILINNAGIMAIRTAEYTENGWEKQIGTNHFGHVYLFSLLESNLMKSEKIPRVVTLASTAHQFESVKVDDLHFKEGRMYTPWGAYGQRKLESVGFILNGKIKISLPDPLFPRI